jgi:hypothetical protein
MGERIKADCVHVRVCVHELNSFFDFKSCQEGRTQTLHTNGK